MEKNQLKEIKKHGTVNFPCAFYCTESDSKDLIVKHHWHDQLELIYMRQGIFHIEIDMDKYIVNEECICFINSEELHFVKSNHPCKESAIVFDLKMLSFEMFDSIQGSLIQPLLNGELKMPHFIFKKEKYGEEILKEYYEILESYKIGGQISQKPEGNITENLSSQIKIKASLLKILALLYENNLLIKNSDKNKDYRIEYIKTAISYIQNNYSEKIHIKDLAKQINMNEQYFCRFFKKMIGKTPMEYVNEYRIKKTKELLKETNRQVMDICLECGFHNMGNFIKVFKKYTGKSPMKYRKEFDNKKS
ncbi:AraC family transcriptional regulator [Clostridium taeniosporum]|uniref:AraC family transcriptional regulator n=1 Tax=Clostridium taeniosporum TaxID=394958 RepID=A0A1D7XNC9_9CLOT|nr:AraC family transcriptional regulator [Clostridium taeniosporum]AOR24824.1 AraC family transcriptional regulator [Clostridium taeniosporum]